MKKISELLKPYLSIIFGVLLFLYFFDWLSAKGGFLALGIIAVVLSVCFVGVGLLGVLAGDKFSKDLKNVTTKTMTMFQSLLITAWCFLEEREGR